MPYDLQRPPNQVALPPGYRLVWNRIARSRVEHTLDCGCVIAKGTPYHSIGVKAYGQLLYHKRHVFGCIEDPTPRPQFRAHLH